MEVTRLEGADWLEARRLCCETADSGQGIPQDRWPFFGEYWVGPYQRLESRWGYAAKDGGKIVGYLTGCPDTASFYVRRWLFHRVPLFLKVAGGFYGDTLDTRRFLDRAKGLAAYPRAKDLRELLKRYPAHLHVNVNGAYRGKGVGRLLVERLCEDLKREGSAGVHLSCGAHPVPFYQKAGFTLLQELRSPAGVPYFVLGRRLR